MPVTALGGGPCHNRCRGDSSGGHCSSCRRQIRYLGLEGGHTLAFIVELDQAGLQILFQNRHAAPTLILEVERAGTFGGK